MKKIIASITVAVFAGAAAFAGDCAAKTAGKAECHGTQKVANKECCASQQKVANKDGATCPKTRLTKASQKSFQMAKKF